LASVIDDCYLFFKNEEHLLFTKFTYFIDAYFWNSLNFESYQIGNFLVEKELLDIFQLQIPELVGLVIHLGSLAMLEVA
jgi:hypothetical protein